MIDGFQEKTTKIREETSVNSSSNANNYEGRNVTNQTGFISLVKEFALKILDLISRLFSTIFSELWSISPEWEELKTLASPTPEVVTPTSSPVLGRGSPEPSALEAERASPELHNPGGGCYVISALQGLFAVREGLGESLTEEQKAIFDKGNANGNTIKEFQQEYTTAIGERNVSKQQDIAAYLNYLLGKMNFPKVEFSYRCNLGLGTLVSREVTPDNALFTEEGNSRILKVQWEGLTSKGKLEICSEEEETDREFVFKEGSEPKVLFVACPFESERWERMVTVPAEKNKTSVAENEKTSKQDKKVVAAVAATRLTAKGKKAASRREKRKLKLNKRKTQGLREKQITKVAQETTKKRVSGLRKKERVFDPSNKSYEEIKVPLDAQGNAFAKYKLEAMIVHHGTGVQAGHYTTWLPDSKIHINDHRIEKNAPSLKDTQLFVYRKIS